MRKSPIVFAVLGLSTCLLLPGFAAGTRFNMRPGLWEFTREPPSLAIAPELLDRMKPQQRDAAEARLAEDLAHQQPQRRLVCISNPGGLERRFDGRDLATQDCRFSVSFLASTYVDGHVECTGDPRSSGTFRLEILDPKTFYLTGELALIRADGTKVANARDVTHGRWAGENCSQAN